MTQKVTQNSVLSQNWVKCTVCTHPWPRLCACCTLGWPCRGALGAVSWPSPGRIVACVGPCRCAHARWRIVSQRYVATQGRVASPFRSRYKICIATLAPTALALRAVLSALPRVSLPPPPPPPPPPPAAYRGALHDTKSAPSATIQFFFYYRNRGATQLTIQTLYRSILILPGCTSYRRPPQSCSAHSLPYRGRARPCRAPLLAFPGLRACSVCCVPAQPVTCLLNLLCACSACCVLAQSIVCRLSLLCVPTQPAVCLLSLLCTDSACCVPAQPTVCHNTTCCIVTQF